MSKELLDICIIFLDEMAGTENEGNANWRKAIIAYKNATGSDYKNILEKRIHKFNVGDQVRYNSFGPPSIPVYTIENIDYTDGTYIFDKSINSFNMKRVKFELADRNYLKVN